MSWLARLFHIHSDPNWQLNNVHRFYQCRCGARRVCRAYSNLDGPVFLSGWPELRDKHGMSIDDTGWVKS